MNGAIGKTVTYAKIDRLAIDKHSSLLGPFIRYEENGVL